METATSILLIIKLVPSIGHMPIFSSKSKAQRGMVSTSKVCRSGQSIFFINYRQIINRNYSNKFFSIDLQKTKTCPK